MKENIRSVDLNHQAEDGHLLQSLVVELEQLVDSQRTRLDLLEDQT